MAVKIPHHPRIEAPLIGFRLGDDLQGLFLGSARDGAGRQEAEQNLPDMAVPSLRQPASYLGADLQQTSVMRTQFIDITIPGNTNLGGYDTQVIPDQVHDRGMLRRFLGIIEDTPAGIGQRRVDRTFDGLRRDEALPGPHEYLAREDPETIPHPKLIHRLGLVEDIF